VKKTKKFFIFIFLVIWFSLKPIYSVLITPNISNINVNNSENIDIRNFNNVYIEINQVNQNQESTIPFDYIFNLLQYL